ncbi:thiamine pyrophosphate-dependent enzyme [Caldanaerobius polysaccharolyticus]|uniref:thiamine pyrophosphate-dependent enzyme n=1 Tax=Caldanaerobius polysaccharolyticus TaxID=44256 RepID=UPI000479653E|nr:thiamine pyrophosphate-dependent enzyme [Caldanaerobius polysaccharolyticus]
MAVVFQKPRSMTDKPMHYCPGCTHGIVHRLIGEVIDELGIQRKAIGVASVGCSVFIYDYINCDFQEASHGRAPAVATGIKRVIPDSVVFTYQGDGDLAAIGTGEIVHAAARGERITVVYVNNAVYGMTGGQMAPTTLLGQKTLTTPYGRNADVNGYPIRICEMLSTLDGAKYIARVSVHDIKHIRVAKKAIKEAFVNQIKGIGFSLVEVLSTCPTNWGLTPIESIKWLEHNLIPYYPLKVFKSPEVAD